jgi:hypothetical protein
MTNINVTQKYLLVFKNSEIIVWGGGREREREKRERKRERERMIHSKIFPRENINIDT